MTHAELVARAVTWLRNTRRCSVVFAECGSWFGGEIPDAIGWNHRGVSTLVECKASLSDFRADRLKDSRKREGLGVVRIYLAPQGLVPVAEVPEAWGLAQVVRSRNGRLTVRVTKKPVEPYYYAPVEGRAALELALLVAEFRRLSEKPPPWVKCRNCDAPVRRVGGLVGLTPSNEETANG